MEHGACATGTALRYAHSLEAVITFAMAGSAPSFVFRSEVKESAVCLNEHRPDEKPDSFTSLRDDNEAGSDA